MVNSKQKGKRGELEWVHWLKDNGWTGARRGQQFKGGADSPDVVNGIPETHCEVKLVERLNIYKAIEQACEDCGSADVPYVAHRRKHKKWLITIPAERLLQFSKNVLKEV